MIKEGFVRQVCRLVPCSAALVADVLEAAIEVIETSVARGEEVQFAGFGTFKPKYCAARTGRNPHTNQPVPIPARIQPTFVVGNRFKAAVVRKVK